MQGHLVDLVQREVKALLQSALEVALSVIRANSAVLEGLGAYLEGDLSNDLDLLYYGSAIMPFGLPHEV